MGLQGWILDKFAGSARSAAYTPCVHKLFTGAPLSSYPQAIMLYLFVNYRVKWVVQRACRLLFNPKKMPMQAWANKCSGSGR